MTVSTSSIHAIVTQGQNSMGAAKTFASVSGGNIANVNTPGYSRQTLQFQALSVPGMGVRTAGPMSVRDWYVSSSLMARRGDLGFHQGRLAALKFAEPVLNELDGAGLTFAMEGFKAALTQLSANPGSLAERLTAVASAQELAQQFSQTSAQLQTASKSALSSARAQLADVNELASQIASLNQKIASAQNASPPANELVDQRDALLQDLSALVDIQVVAHKSGSVSVFVGGGRALVSDMGANALVTDPIEVAPGGDVSVRLRSADGGSFALLQPLGGAVGGALDGYLGSLKPALERLDELAFELADQFNALHQEGFGLDGDTGLDFFEPLEGVSGAASSLRVSQALVSDPGLLAAALDLDALPGDNENLLALASLLAEAPMTADGLTLAEGWERLTLDFYSTVRSSELSLAGQQAAVSQLEELLASRTGVSVDEELLNLDRANQAFQASARLIQTADEMIQVVMAMVR